MNLQYFNNCPICKNINNWWVYSDRYRTCTLNHFHVDDSGTIFYLSEYRIYDYFQSNRVDIHAKDYDITIPNFSIDYDNLDLLKEKIELYRFYT
jgi:hypothetical protein